MISARLAFGAASMPLGFSDGVSGRIRRPHRPAALVGSAVLPTAIANARYLPVHLLPEEERRLRESAYGEPEGELDV